MRTHKLISLFSLILLAALALTACGTPALAQSEPTSEPPVRTLRVNGSGQVFISPDIAYISIGVHTEGEEAAAVVADNNDQAAELVAALEDAGVAEKDIQTTNFSISPRQEYDDQGNLQGITYVVDNSVNVTVRDLESIGDLLDAAVQAGANAVNGISFDVSDKVSALSQARQAAVENARAQAEELAAAAGVELGAIQSINSYGGFPTPVEFARGGGAIAQEAAANVPISPGQNSLTVDVEIVYEIQ